MNQHKLLIGTLATALTALVGSAQAKDGELRLSTQGTNHVLQVQGDRDDEWRFETSTDLSGWTLAPALGTVLSGDEDAPAVAVGSPGQPRGYYRAVRTAGLYDPTLLRTVRLTFTQSNWQTLLANGRNTGSNTLATFSMDNGATNSGVGVRYRGNTSYTGMGGGGAPLKKSVNIELDSVDPKADLMGFNTLNLNNAYGDKTLLHEPLYFTVMSEYAFCPKGSLARLYINGAYWGVYSFAQQEDSALVREWCPSNDGDRWRAPNMPAGGGGGPGGGQGSGVSALSYLGTSVATYQQNYELKTDNSTNAWQRLMHATDVLNTTATATLRDKVEEVLAVDRWLWFLAIENLFADDDSYFNKGADYGFYYEPESGRIHPIEHDGNEAFLAGDVQLSPVQGATTTTRPVLYKLLGIPELRQRYLAHMRTALKETYNPVVMTPLIDQFVALSAAAVAADTRKGFTMATYTNEIKTLKTFVTNRYNFLINHAELRPEPPAINTVHPPAHPVTATDSPWITAEVAASGANGISSAWLYHRNKSYGRFTAAQMFDDGAHGDGAAGDGVFGAAVTPYPAGNKVRYYVEARSANTAKAASFSPTRAEEWTYNYRVILTSAPNTPVVINELMAANVSTLADPQGEFDDWIELRNLTDEVVDLTGRYLSDEPNNPRKWAFPAGTTIPAEGYLLVWADEDGKTTSGLHASFKLSAGGEELFLTDTDANHNAVLDSVTFGDLGDDLAYGRQADNAEVWVEMTPTPGRPNQ
jgi:hypothetical protein